MNSTELMTYLMDNPFRNRPTLTPSGQLVGSERTKIYADIFVAGIPSVDELDQTVKFTVILRATWVDWRLVYSRYKPGLAPDQYLVFHYMDAVFQEISQIASEAAENKPNLPKFWKPDLYFVNERGALRIENTEPNVMLRLHPNGTIIFSQKLVMKTQCEMKFHRFPLDRQDCPLYLSSNNFPDTDLAFEWNRQADGGAITLSDHLTLPEFTVTGVTYKDSCNYDNSIREIANFSCLEANVHMERLFVYYFIEIYVPSMMVVFLSWMNFWIDIEAVAARISLGLLTVLTTSTQRSGIVNRMPRVSYTKAIDIWMTFCLVMVVFAMLEYSLVNSLAHKAKMGKELLSRFIAVDDSDDEEELPKQAVVRGRRRSSISPEQLKQLGYWKQIKYRTRRLIKRLRTNKAYAVDVMSRVVFPAFFAIFNFMYWFTYLVVFTENPQ